MSTPRGGAVPLLLVVAAFAVLVGALVFLRAPAPRTLRAGDPAPDFELSRVDGGELALADLRGRVVFVNFWGTWCPPCRDEAPSLRRLYERLRGDGLELLAVSIDAAGAHEEVRAFRSEFGLEFPILLDPEKRVYQAYGATGVPESFLIDAEGRLVERYIGPRDWDDPRYARAIQRLLAVRETDRETSGG